MTPFLLSLFLLAGGLAPAPPSVGGAWTLSGEVSGVSYTAQCTFVQTGTAFTGKCGDDKAMHDVKGTIEGDTIKFSHDSTYNEDAITLNYTGKIGADGKLSGDVEVEPYAVDGTFSAVKAAAAGQ